MLKSKWFYIVLVAASVAGGLWYEKYHASKVKDEAAYFMQTAKSPVTTNNTLPKNIELNPKKLFGVLMITSGIPNSQNMANGVMCVENASSVDKVDLFMPDMGHGSEPPKVTSTPAPKGLAKYDHSVPHFGCYSVESMQLFMPGLWQVRVFFKEGNMGIFTLNIEK